MENGNGTFLVLEQTVYFIRIRHNESHIFEVNIKNKTVYSIKCIKIIS